MREPAIDRYIKWYDEALKVTHMEADGSYDEEELRTNLESIVQLPSKREQLIKFTKHVVNTLEKVGHCNPSGQLVFPGWEYLEEPKYFDKRQLIRSNDGKIAEERRAPLRFFLEDAMRARQHSKHAHISANWKSDRGSYFAQWLDEQRTKGRPPDECHFENFVIESGYLHPLDDDDSAKAAD